MPKALPDGVMLTTGATAISAAHAIDMANQAIATGRVRLFGSEPLGNTNARASRQTNANPQPVPFAQTVNDSNDVVVPATIAGMEPLTITLPRASPTPISTRSQAMGWRGRRAARTRPVLEYATSRTMPAGRDDEQAPGEQDGDEEAQSDRAALADRPGAASRPTAAPAIAPLRARRGRRSCHGRRRPAAWTRSTGTGPVGRGVRVPADDGAEQQLAHVLDAAVDVAADVVGVVRLHRARAVHGRARTRSRKPGAYRSTCASIASVMSPVQPLGTWQ